jgi:hypothetical protein
VTCVYMLYDEHDQPIYVGMGSGVRPYDSQRRYGGRAEIIAFSLDNILASKLEGVLISILGREGIDKFGILKNRLGPTRRGYKPARNPGHRRAGTVAVTQTYLERLALDLGANRRAMEAWRYRGKVPPYWRLRLLHAAADRGLSIPLELFDTFRPVRKETPRVKRPSRAKGGHVVPSPG